MKDKNKIHEVDVLSGAFLLIRNSVLKKIGLLDEQFFMYGEDIDISYRIKLGGFKNYYFPKTKIIHYKGESTKKTSLNYVFLFYKAMMIFAKKLIAADETDSELINVFIPTTPNPTSGFLLMFPEDEVIYLDLTFEEASKFIVSAGTSNPKN